MTLDGSDTENSSPPSTLPPIPDAQIVVNPDANWKPRSLEAAIEEGKQRKLEELGQEGWDSEDELLCLRREQWRLMRALGIETQETEPGMCIVPCTVRPLIATSKLADGDLEEDLHWLRRDLRNLLSKSERLLLSL